MAGAGAQGKQLRCVDVACNTAAERDHLPRRGGIMIEIIIKIARVEGGRDGGGAAHRRAHFRPRREVGRISGRRWVGTRPAKIGDPISWLGCYLGLTAKLEESDHGSVAPRVRPHRPPSASAVRDEGEAHVDDQRGERHEGERQHREVDQDISATAPGNRWVVQRATPAPRWSAGSATAPDFIDCLV